MQRRYITVDVFTDRAFGGNPLAVVLDAGGLSTAQMQAIATEFNYSETTFVLPPRDAANDAAGAHLHRAQGDSVRRPSQCRHRLRAGDAGERSRRRGCCSRRRRGSGAGRNPDESRARVVGAELTAPQPLKRLTQVSPLKRRRPASRCRRPTSGPTGIRRRSSRSGLPFLVVEVASRDALRRARPDAGGLRRMFPCDGAIARLLLHARRAAGREALRSAGADVSSGLERPVRGPGHRQRHGGGRGAARRS